MKRCIDPTFFNLLAQSYARVVGQPLVPDPMSAEAGARWLYEDAPFGVLAHNAEQDPVFVYGNKAAQRRFGYDWNELTALPSRLSAEAPDREERRSFLERVERDGFVSGYRGIRVMKDGKRFLIENATVWQLLDEQGVYRGQAAMLPQSTDL